MSAIATGRWRFVQGLAAICVAGLALASAWANLTWFASKLEAGYEGPSLSVSRDWRGMRRDVLTLAQKCGADLPSGRIIVDDATQQAMMSFPATTPVTYVALQASLVGESFLTSLNRFHPNSALMLCSSFPATGLKIDGQSGELCCHVFRGD